MMSRKIIQWSLGIVAPTCVMSMHGFADGWSQQLHGQACIFLNPPLGQTKVPTPGGRAAGTSTADLNTPPNKKKKHKHLLLLAQDIQHYWEGL
jgi:hypothetical protein